MNTPNKSTVPFKFGTKAQTLAQLIPRVKSATIPKVYYFTVEEWRSNPQYVLSDITENFGDTSLAVRSSAIAEDGATSSMAGAFLSKLNITSKEPSNLERAINSVVASLTENLKDEVLIQPMIENIDTSGVIMTYDIVNGAPYYCIDYDDITGRTDGVTSGSGIHKSLFVYRHAKMSLVKSPKIISILSLSKELELICNCSALDIEFAINSNGQLFLFQVRRISLVRNWHPVTERRVKRQLLDRSGDLEQNQEKIRAIPRLLN